MLWLVMPWYAAAAEIDSKSPAGVLTGLLRGLALPTGAGLPRTPELSLSRTFEIRQGFKGFRRTMQHLLGPAGLGKSESIA